MKPKPRSQAQLEQLQDHPLAAVVGAMLLMLLLALLAMQLYGLRYRGRVFPGVALAGHDLGGLSAAEAASRISELPALDGDILLRDPEDGRSWLRSASELGLRNDAANLAQLAIRIGRNEDAGWFARLFAPMQIRRTGFELADLIGLDEERARQTLDELAPEVVIAPENARVERQGDETVSVRSTTGRNLDVEGTLAALSALVAAPVTDTLDIALAYTSARIFDLDNVSRAYNLVTSGPVELSWREGQRYEIGTELLEAWTSIEEVPTREGDRLPSIIIDRDAIREWVAPLATDIDHPPRDARYAIDPATGRLTVRDPGSAGTRLDVEASVDMVIRAAYTEQRVAELAVTLEPRQVHEALERELNTRLVEIRRVSSSFAGSPTGRLQNMLVSAERLDGLTLAPGQEASLLEGLGEVSSEAGYDMLQLLGGAPGARSVPAPADETASETVTALEPTQAGLAGGISQVSTTFFRAAFWTGLPVLERHAPPIRIGWLEPPVGLDATLFPDNSDLRFVNDSSDYLVFDLELNTERGVLTCVVYGRPEDRREVRMIGPTVTRVLPASRPTSLREPSLSIGESAQIGWAREGATAVVERHVMVNGIARVPDLFTSVYSAAGDLVVIGSGSP